VRAPLLAPTPLTLFCDRNRRGILKDYYLPFLYTPSLYTLSLRYAAIEWF
jgi:hypothetical protein